MTVSIQREKIPGGESICRHIFFPHMYNKFNELVWMNVFEFPGSQCESTIWRRYVNRMEDIRRLGCERERELKATNPEKQYRGAIWARVRDVRRFRNPNNHGFYLVHEPAEGEHHVHICYHVSPGTQMTKNDKNELKLALKRIFSDVLPHACS